jgi:hypothetical protein
MGQRFLAVRGPDTEVIIEKMDTKSYNAAEPDTFETKAGIELIEERD